MPFAFDRDVAIPPVKKPRPRWGWLAAMEPGDSKFVPGVERNALTVASGHYAKKLGFRYICRAEEGGARIWRVS